MFKFLLLYFYGSEYFTCMYVCVSGIQKALESPGAGAAGGCEPPSEFRDLNLDPPEEQAAL